MSNFSDDYVAQILKRDAERRDPNRFIANGLGSLLSNTRPRSKDAPKPNTRFLKHIVKEADTHNAALRKKEEQESRARLRGLKRDQERERRRSRSPRRDRDRGHERREREVYSARRVHERRSKESKHDGVRTEHRISDEERRPRRRGSEHDTDSETSVKQRPAASDVLKPCDSRTLHDDTVDSDPLEDIIGPKPASKTKARGRGAHKDSSMDERFKASYDPAQDVDVEDGEILDDWEMALEAMRDRAKWKKSGAERLRAAGFTEDEVSKWEKSGGSKGGEGNIEHVRWRKKGEGREWDRGKVVKDQHVELRPEWGRLKGT